MDRRAWQATVHGVTRVGHDLVIKPPMSFRYNAIVYLIDYNLVLTPFVYALGNQKNCCVSFYYQICLIACIPSRIQAVKDTKPHIYYVILAQVVGMILSIFIDEKSWRKSVAVLSDLVLI